MTRVLYILSNINKALQYEWTAEQMDREQTDLRFILLQPWPRTRMQAFLEEKGIPHKVYSFTSRRQYPRLLWQLYRDMGSWRPDVVHTHLIDASFLGLLAARLRGIPMRVHTRHHAIENHYLSRKAVWLDKRINALSTHIVSISGNVEQILQEKEKVPSRKIVRIPHGFQLEALAHPDAAAVEALRIRHELAGKGPVIGVISRFLALKGMDYTIAAFKELLPDYPGAVLLFAGVWGDYEPEIDRQLQELPPHSWRKIGFVEDLPALYGLLDMHVHVPVARESESFGQTYIEALAAGVAAVFTLSGVAPEVIRHRENAWVVPYRDSAAILEGMRALLGSADLRNRLVAQGRQDVQPYAIEQMILRLERLYTTGSAKIL
ncbi:MAG: glycosyltransferase family 4 protein [Bacteroidetes bacterium]|nr:glycosyltransferase family 4 protein [Bacteroidota bacterium]